MLAVTETFVKKAQTRIKSSVTLRHVEDKINECEFFIALMRGSRENPEVFGRFLGAFLCCFGSIFQRLEHVTKKSAKDISEVDPDWALLFELRHDEVHRQGVMYYRVPVIRKIPRLSHGSRLGSPRFARGETRFNLAWDDQHFTYQFASRSGDLVTVCSDALFRVRRHLGGLGDSSECVKKGERDA